MSIFKYNWWNSGDTFRLENLMIKKIFTLFKIARTLAVSDALKIIYKFHKPPLFIRVFFKIFSISFDKTNSENMNISDEERLCKSIQSGKSFIF